MTYIQTNKVRVTCKVTGSTGLNITSYKSLGRRIASPSMNKLYENKLYSQFCVQLKQEALLIVHWGRQKQRHHSHHTGHNISHSEITFASLGYPVYSPLFISLLALAVAEQLSPRKQLGMNDSMLDWTDRLVVHL